MSHKKESLQAAINRLIDTISLVGGADITQAKMHLLLAAKEELVRATTTLDAWIVEVENDLLNAAPD